jgi:riboflavin synthase
METLDRGMPGGLQNGRKAMPPGSRSTVAGASAPLPAGRSRLLLSSLDCVFTGIVRELGRVVSLGKSEGQVRLSVAAPLLAPGLTAGDSVAIDGCCLTVIGKDGEKISFDLSRETLSRSALGSLEAGRTVNLEPSIRAGEPLGGHYVQGHVDAVGRVSGVEPEGEGVRMWIDVPEAVLRYCVEKGSLTVAGVSLTVAELTDHLVAVALIPHTLAVTTLGTAKPGDPVNLEADVIAKYVERLLSEKTQT